MLDIRKASKNGTLLELLYIGSAKKIFSIFYSIL